MFALLNKPVERLAVWLTAIGGLLIVVQMLWISYGVFMRYVMSSPDGTVTEATALLLFPVAFLGLAFALKEDAYPKVSFLPDALSPRGRHWLEALNMFLMMAVGVYFSITAVDATLNSYESGAASEILLWPRWLFWAPGAVALLVFTLYAGLRLALMLTRPEPVAARRG